MALRDFTDPDGTHWQVYDVRPDGAGRMVTPGLEDGWLVFESATHKCRIVPPPPDWETCPDEELLRLMRSCDPAPKTVLQDDS